MVYLCRILNDLKHYIVRVRCVLEPLLSYFRIRFTIIFFFLLLLNTRPNVANAAMRRIKGGAEVFTNVGRE